MTGLAYFLDSPGVFQGVDRAEYLPVRGARLFSGCVFHKEARELYQSLSYPLGKTRRGLKKWLKNLFKRFHYSPHKCSECGQDVMSSFLLRFIGYK